jgi:radical SAM protein with 4Fe4S-binding SPASM domain
MRVIAAIDADLEMTPLGTRSRLADEIGGVPILRRTIERIGRARRIDGVYVLCPSAQHERCVNLLAGSPATVRPHDAGPGPWASLVQVARKWSLDGWRGGVGATTCFDEFTNCHLLSGLLETVEADAVYSIPAAAPLIDPGLADRLIARKEEADEEARLVFCQVPPGVAGILLEKSIVCELAEKNSPLGWVFAYKPDNPQKDLIFQPCCVEVSGDLGHAVGRLIADTDRSTERVAALLGELDEPDLDGIGRWLLRREAEGAEALPHEVEIELTTDDPYPDALLRPRGSRVERRGPIDPAIVRQIAAEVSRFDDALIVLGGFGDPLRHPQFASVLQAVGEGRSDGRGVYGLAVRTTAADLNNEHIEAVLSGGVDIVQVPLDAWTGDLYGRLQSPRDPPGAKLDEVLGRLDRLSAIRQERRSVRPIVLPEMTKSRDNVHELDDFHDGWLRRVGAVSITGYSHFGAQCEDRSVMAMAPSARGGCRRIRSRCLVLADGRVTMCDQDFQGRHALGRIGERTLEDIWRSDEFERVRSAHRQGRFDPTPLCATCGEWHRP